MADLGGMQGERKEGLVAWDVVRAGSDDRGRWISRLVWRRGGGRGRWIVRRGKGRRAGGLEATGHRGGDGER
jgi:hypothetical protein